MPTRNYFFAIVLCYLFLSSVFALDSDRNALLDYSLILVALYCIIISIVFSNFLIPKRGVAPSLILFLALFFSFVAALLHSSPELAAFFFGIWVYFTSLLVASSTIRDPVLLASKLTKYLSLISIAVFLFSVYQEPFTLNRYAAFAHNQNSYAFFPAAVVVLLAGVGLSSINAPNQRPYLSYITAVTAILFLLSTTSRAAVASVIIPLMLYALISPKKRILSRLSIGRLGVLVSAACGLILLKYFGFDFLEGLIQKTLATYEQGELGRGRVSGWAAALKTWSFFGHGPSYPDMFASSLDNYGHNIFITSLSRVGAVPSIFLAAFFFVVWLDLARSIKKGERYFSIPAFLLLSSYLVQSTFSSTFVAPALWFAVFFYVFFLRCRAYDHSHQDASQSFSVRSVARVV